MCTSARPLQLSVRPTSRPRASSTAASQLLWLDGASCSSETLLLALRTALKNFTEEAFLLLLKKKKKQVCHFLTFPLLHFPAIVLLIMALSIQIKLTGSGRRVKLLQLYAAAPVSHFPMKTGRLISARPHLINLIRQSAPPSRLGNKDRNLQGCHPPTPTTQDFSTF